MLYGACAYTRSSDAPTCMSARRGHDGCRSSTHRRRLAMSIGTILLIILILVLIGAFPSWPYSRGWGYYPTGIVGIVVLVVIIMLLTGRL
jgi:hypothetical protein